MTNVSKRLPDVRKFLNDGDPLRPDGGEAAGLSTVDAERIRRVIISAALESRPSRAPWLRPFAMAAVAALLVVVGTMTGHQVVVEPAPATGTPEPPVAIGGSGGDGGDRRQLQFSTPGGTRIIWIFDQNLRLQESMP
jgi:hypothetical protein